MFFLSFVWIICCLEVSKGFHGPTPIFTNYGDEVYFSLDKLRFPDDITIIEDSGKCGHIFNTDFTTPTQIYDSKVALVIPLLVKAITYPCPDQNELFVGVDRQGRIILMNKQNFYNQSPFIIETNDCYDLQQFVVQDSIGVFALCGSIGGNTKPLYLLSVTCSIIGQKINCDTKEVSFDPPSYLLCARPSFNTQLDRYYGNQLWLSLYCQNEESVLIYTVSYLPFIVKYTTVIEFKGLVQFKQVQRVLFFDDNIIMILDKFNGLYMIEYSFKDQEFNYNLVQLQAFQMQNIENFYIISQIIEQDSMRSAPQGIFVKDYSFSFVLVSNYFLYEVILPSEYNKILIGQIYIHDKINLRTRFDLLKTNGVNPETAQITYDAHFYYVCITTRNKTEQSECRRLQRHIVVNKEQ